jgi:hypothetical protein
MSRLARTRGEENSAVPEPPLDLAGTTAVVLDVDATIRFVAGHFAEDGAAVFLAEVLRQVRHQVVGPARSHG